MTLIGLATLLKPTKYTLPSFPILLNQSVGAAVSTGSHGSSTRFGTIRDSVVALRLVSCEGDVKTIAPKIAQTESVFESIAAACFCLISHDVFFPALDVAPYPVVKAMVSSDAKEILSSDALLKIARCSGG